jgi:hypothetical protein
LDDPLPNLCPAVTLSHQDGHHSAVAVIESSFDPGERLQAPGTLWFLVAATSSSVCCVGPIVSFFSLIWLCLFNATLISYYSKSLFPFFKQLTGLKLNMKNPKFINGQCS